MTSGFIQPIVPSWTCKNCPAHLSGIFADLSAEQMRGLEKARVLDRFLKGQVLYYEGHRPLAAFCLLSGQVKIYKTLADGRHRMIGLAGPGDLLGHECFLKKDVYGANAEAIEESYVCSLPKCAVLPILEKNPATLLRLLDKLTQERKGSYATEASGPNRQSVTVRLAHLLIDFNLRFGRPVHWGSSIELSLTRAEIASMLGTTTETTIRLLNRLQKQGILTLGSHVIDIKDLAALERLTR